jgi:uncharacterized protein with HEPN domain
MPKKHLPNSAIKPDAHRLLEDVLRAGRFIVEWTIGFNERRLWADKPKRAAVERQFEVIAEALHRLRELDPRTWHDIPDADTATRLGEAIRRDYDAIDYGILWRATQKEVPEMLQRVEDLLASGA